MVAFGSCSGILAAGRQGTPQLLQEGALATGTTVCALSTGCWADHAAFVGGPPPTKPGFDSAAETRARLQLFFAWVRRRTLLMCLLRATQRSRAGGGDAKHPKHTLPSSGGGATAATAPAVAAAGDGEVLLRVASLPDELWQGPLIFQFL